MLALKFWIFNIDFTTLLSFVFGIIAGMMILSLIYALLVVMSLRDKKYKVEVDQNSLTEVDASNMIKRAIKSFNDKNLRGDLTQAQHFKNLAYDLVYGIASSFFPNSKYPLFEITVDEAIDLIGYVQKRLEDILNMKVIKLFKKMKVSDIISISLTSKNVISSKAFHVTKDIGKTAMTIKKVVDVINPLNWVKRIVVNTATNIIMHKLFQVTLGILGEEAFKIYSKKVLNIELQADAGIDDIVNDLSSEIEKEINVKEKNKNQDENIEVLDVVETRGLRFKSRKNKLEYSFSGYDSIFDQTKRLKYIKADLKESVEVQDEKEEK